MSEPFFSRYLKPSGFLFSAYRMRITASYADSDPAISCFYLVMYAQNR